MQMEMKMGITLFISDQIDFKTKAIKNVKEGHYNDKAISTRRVYYTYQNICTQCRSIQIHRQIPKDIKGEIDGNTITGDFNTHSINRSSKQKISKAA